MSWVVLLIQVILPVALLLWAWLRPSVGRATLVVQWTAVAAILFGLAQAAFWTMPPFWFPYVYGALLVLIVLRHVFAGRLSAQGLWRLSASQTVVLSAVILLGIIGGFLGIQGLRGSALPDQPVVDIAAPFPAGHYLIASGGTTETINHHLKTLDESVERFRPWRGQSYGVDIFRIESSGIHKEGWLPENPARYVTFGTPVLSPCKGRIARVVDGVRDMPVPEMDRSQMAGNYVVVDCGDFFVFLAHLRQNSIHVETNQSVGIGDPLGQMGNSGNSSEPHLHVHAQKGLPDGMPLGGEPVWLTIRGDFPARNDRIIVP